MSEPVKPDLKKIREGLDIKSPEPDAAPPWTTRVNADVLFQNRSITAQVCVKAAAKMLAADLVAGHGDREKAEADAVRIAERFMKVADRYIRGDVSKAVKKARAKK